MHDDSVLVAIDEALRSSTYCACGKSLGVTTHDNAAWLECQAFARPTHLPASLASLLRELVHHRTRVVALPA